MAMYKKIAFVLEETYESRFDNIPTTFGHYFLPWPCLSNSNATDAG